MRSEVDFVGRHGRRMRSSLAVAGAGALLILTPHPAHAASSAAHAAASPACGAAVPACAATGSPASAAGALGLPRASGPRTLSVNTSVGIVSLRIGVDSLSSCGCGSPLTAHLTRTVPGSRTHSNPSSLNGSLPDRAPAKPVPSGGAVSSCGCGTGAAVVVVVQVDVTVGLGAGTSSCGCATTVPATKKHHHKPPAHGGGTPPPSGGTPPPTTSHGGGTPPATTPHGGGTTPPAVVSTVESSPAASTGNGGGNGGGEGLADTGSPLLPGLAGLLVLGVGGFLGWRRRAIR
jgi:hypothetical protein